MNLINLSTNIRRQPNPYYLGKVPTQGCFNQQTELKMNMSIWNGCEKKHLKCDKYQYP